MANYDTGMMALPRTPLEISKAEEMEVDQTDIVDVSQLPPG